MKMVIMRQTNKLRKLLDRKKIIVTPFCFNAWTAMIIDKLGFEAVYMSGGNTSRSFGLADVGFQTLTEVTGNIHHITDSIDIPLIADADTGFGNAIHTIRAVKEYIHAGAAAMHIEDQSLFKRCGYVSGKILASKEEMVGKYRAADYARREEDENFIIIARTDAIEIGGLDEVIERGNAYAKAGADVIFPSPPFKSVHDIERLCKEIQAPILYNWERTHKLSIEKMQELGIAIVILGVTRGVTDAVWDLAYGLKTKGTQALTEYAEKWKPIFQKMPIDSQTFSGMLEIQKLEKEFLPKEETSLRYNKQ